jgi:hypothetical protein
MILVFSALTPVFLMFMFGYILKNGDLIFDSFWPPAEKTTFYFFSIFAFSQHGKSRTRRYIRHSYHHSHHFGHTHYCRHHMIAETPYQGR